jgi:RHS repeat-associated protein
MPPLRFPGQYHDAESDLFENWNRYYDPFAGRYLQPDPLMHSAGYLESIALVGAHASAFVYAFNDPQRFTDPTGLYAPAPPMVPEPIGNKNANGSGDGTIYPGPVATAAGAGAGLSPINQPGVDLPSPVQAGGPPVPHTCSDRIGWTKKDCDANYNKLKRDCVTKMFDQGMSLVEANSACNMCSQNPLAICKGLPPDPENDKLCVKLLKGKTPYKWPHKSTQ